VGGEFGGGSGEIAWLHSYGRTRQVRRAEAAVLFLDWIVPISIPLHFQIFLFLFTPTISRLRRESIRTALACN
jgi:hypothetical protein